MDNKLSEEKLYLSLQKQADKIRSKGGSERAVDRKVKAALGHKTFGQQLKQFYTFKNKEVL